MVRNSVEANNTVMTEPEMTTKLAQCQMRMAAECIPLKTGTGGTDTARRLPGLELILTNFKLKFCQISESANAATYSTFRLFTGLVIAARNV